MKLTLSRAWFVSKIISSPKWFMLILFFFSVCFHYFCLSLSFSLYYWSSVYHSAFLFFSHSYFLFSFSSFIFIFSLSLCFSFSPPPLSFFNNLYFFLYFLFFLSHSPFRLFSFFWKRYLDFLWYDNVPYIVSALSITWHSFILFLIMNPPPPTHTKRNQGIQISWYINSVLIQLSVSRRLFWLQ